MKKTSLLPRNFTTSLLLVFIWTGLIFAQVNNPNEDRVPNVRTNNSPFLFSPFSVVTVDDYDNFNLGIDFAEVHISTNPLNPKIFYVHLILPLLPVSTDI